jgi:hypothetical protein
MVIPTRNAFRLSPAKTPGACSRQKVKTNLHMFSLPGERDRLSDIVAVLYRDGTVLSAVGRAIASSARKQQEQGQPAAHRIIDLKPGAQRAGMQGRDRGG